MLHQLVLLIVSACWAVFGLAAPSAPDTGPDQARDPTSDGPPEILPADPARSFGALVLSVQDGDSVTLMVDGEMRRFELLGADAPEWLEKARVQRPHAKESRRFLTNLLLGERVLVFEPEPGAQDAIGRRRGYLFREPDGMFVDLEIIRQGYGKVSTRAGEPYEGVLRWYERRARELDRGVWGQPPEPEPETDEASPAETEPAETLPAQARPQPAPKESQPAVEDAFVWITRSGSKYHREGCSHLTATRTRVARDSVRSTHEPCKSCNPEP